jgi:site-specific recombinase XerC
MNSSEAGQTRDAGPQNTFLLPESGVKSIKLKAKDRLKPATVHQELRVLRRMLNVAVRKKLLPANPCAGVEFPVKVKGLFRPHYMGWSEQQRIEFQAPEYLAKHHPDHHRDRPSGLQGADADEEGSGGSGKRGGVDSGFED